LFDVGTGDKGLFSVTKTRKRGSFSAASSSCAKELSTSRLKALRASGRERLTHQIFASS
jgi:hypothetical protein